MISRGVTLRGLEIFEAVATSGSVAQAARATGLSQAAVSQQLKQLETALGRELVDHSRRPMQPTAAGRQFLRRAQEALRQVRQAQAESTALELGHLTDLRLGIIDDFETDLTPDLTIALAGIMRECRLRLLTRPSHALMATLLAGETDIAVCSAPDDQRSGLRERPLLRDPLVLALPAGQAPPDDLSQLQDRPLLRFTRDQLIGRRIEAELDARGLSFPQRFEIDSVASLHALVAAGAGWAITTPLSYLRARRFHGAIRLCRLPFDEAPARRISLFSRPDIDDVARTLAQTLRDMIAARVTGPLTDTEPWLARDFVCLED